MVLYAPQTDFGYLEKVEAMDPEVREFIRSELAWLSDWTHNNTELKNHAEIRKLLNELVDISAIVDGYE